MRVMPLPMRNARSLPLHARGRRTWWIFVCVIPAQGYQQGWNSAFLIHFLLQKKSVREPVLGSPSPTGLSRSIRAPSRSKIALTKDPSSCFSFHFNLDERWGTLHEGHSTDPPCACGRDVVTSAAQG